MVTTGAETTGAGVSSLRKKFLFDPSAIGALLACIPGVNLNEQLTSAFSLVSQLLVERGPGNIMDAPCQFVVLDHVGRV